MRVLLVLLFAGVSLTADGVLPKAFGDDAKPADSSPHPVFTDEQRTHWSFQPPTRAPLPTVKDTSWPRQPIDNFVLATLDAHRFRPAPPADRTTLLRRVTFGLTGLPPSRRDIESFLADDSPEAFARVVDRLLASHHYGEQWARHWLDVVRYADSLGGTANFPFANAYRYRDYVIRAFNKDKPFDRFVLELVAGDLLPAGDAEVEADRMTGPGALLLGPYILNDKVDAAADQIGMLTRALIGMDISCSRCHDHPFEPLTTGDFYALAGIFTSTESKRFERDLVLPGGDKIRVLSVKEGKVENLKVHLRGDPKTLGDTVSRRFPVILAGRSQPKLNDKQSGRLELARWLTRGDHPLTARVIANRIWQRHFGVGLVTDPDNFGVSAVAGPSNHQLLDWLALHLVDRGWSLKALHRTIVLSATYQQSSSTAAVSASNPQASPRNPRTTDPMNHLLWRQNRRRLEAEEIRDSLLYVSGQLDLTMGGSLLARLGLGNAAELKKNNRLQLVVNHFGNILQRSIYRPVIRTELHMAELLEAFDFPGRDEATGQRQASTNAPQALLLMNGPFVLDQARHSAEDLLADQRLDDRARVQQLYLQSLGRAARSDEVTAAIEFITSWNRGLPNTTGAKDRRTMVWQSLCQAMFMLNEFVYVD